MAAATASVDAQPRPAVAARRERDERAEREAAEDGDEDRQPQERDERVARLRSHERGVEAARPREAHDGRAVDRAHVDVDARRQADDRKAHAPVDERHVEVQRALVAGVDREAHGADVEAVLAREGAQRRDRAGDGRRDDEEDREGLAHRRSG